MAIVKEVMLKLESFPLNEVDQYNELPPAGSAHLKVTEKALKRALYSQSVKKPPGLDKLCFGAVCLLSKWDKERIVDLAKGAIHKGHYPALWQRASEVMIHKPSEDNYTKLNVYRMISLLSGMRTVVEKVVEKQVSEDAERRGLLSDGQFGNRHGRTAVDAAATLVNKAHSACTDRNITVVLVIDIKPAFLCVANGRLFNRMKANL